MHTYLVVHNIYHLMEIMCFDGSSLASHAKICEIHNKNIHENVY
jgi:hypothetical protein